MKPAGPLLLLALLATGCATMVHGKNQDVTFTSDPPGATVTIDDAVKGETPMSIALARSAGSGYTVRFSKAGYRDEVGRLERKSSGWYWANIGLVPLIGVFTIIPIVVDSATGAMNRLDPETLHVTMTPLIALKAPTTTETVPAAPSTALPKPPVTAEASRPEPTPAPAPAPRVTPPAELDPRLVIGRWLSEGGTNWLRIGPDLSFEWTSTHGGNYLRGSGRGEVRGDALVLTGSFHAGRTNRDLRLILRRQGNALVGDLQTSRSWPITFVRE